MTSMLRRPALLLVLVAAVFAPAARAALTFDYRVSTYFISFSDNTFANANARYDVHVDVSGNDGDQAPNYTLTTRAGQKNFSWTAGTYSGTGDSFLAVNNVVDPGSSGAAPGDLAMSGGTRGAYDFGYDTGAGGFATDWLDRQTGPGGATLDFQGGGSGLLDAGSLFALVVFVQGDWTSHGTGAGQLEFLGMNAGWNTNFTFDHYDAGLNATVFSASAMADGTAGFGPNLRFRLHGDALNAVPEPGMLALLLVGLLALVPAARVRRRG